MYACREKCVLFDFDNSSGAPQVSMSYEAGQNFTVSADFKTELTSATQFQFLKVDKPLCLKGYDGLMKAWNHRH
jgi:hypothetical protein